MQPITVKFATGQWEVSVDGHPVLNDENKPNRQITSEWSGFVKDSVTFKRTDTAEQRGESPKDIEKIQAEAKARDPGTVTATPGAAPGRPFGEAELDPAAEAKRRVSHQTAKEAADEKRDREAIEKARIADTR